LVLLGSIKMHHHVFFFARPIYYLLIGCNVLQIVGSLIFWLHLDATLNLSAGLTGLACFLFVARFEMDSLHVFLNLCSMCAGE
jgi:hypothetical protein